MQNSWNFLEVWVDPMQSPPYLLMLLGDESGRCQILDPAEQYRLIKRCESYDQAQLWLLEDEYEPIEGCFFEKNVPVLIVYQNVCTNVWLN